MNLRGDRQLDVANALGIVRPAITARMNGQTPWTSADLTALAAYFGVDPAIFLVPVDRLLGGGGAHGGQEALVPRIDLAALVSRAPGPQHQARRRRAPRRIAKPDDEDQLGHAAQLVLSA